MSQNEYDDTPPLRFSDLQAGMKFKPLKVRTSASLVERYIVLTGDDLPIYRDNSYAKESGLDSPVLPPSLLGVFARQSYLGDHRMLPGGIMTSQTFELHRPVPVGATVTLRAEVLEHDSSDPKRRVQLRCRLSTVDGLVATVTINILWPTEAGC